MAVKAGSKITIASTGTAKALSPTTLNARWVQVQSAATNNAAGQNLGDSGVTGPGGSGTNPGVVMAPGGVQFLPWDGCAAGYDLAQINVNGTTGDVFYVLFDY